MAEVVGVSLGVTNEAVADAALNRLLEKSRRVRAEANQAEATAQRALSQIVRRGGRFIGRQAISFVASEVMSDIFASDDAESGAGFFKRYLTAAGTGAAFGAAAGGIPGAAVGAAVNVSATAISDIWRAITEDGKKRDQIEKVLRNMTEESARKQIEFLKSLQESRKEFMEQLFQLRTELTQQARDIIWNSYQYQ